MSNKLSKLSQIFLSFLFGAAVVLIVAIIIGILLKVKAGDVRQDLTSALLFLLQFVFALSISTGIGTAFFTYIDINRTSNWILRTILLIIVPSLCLCVILYIYHLIEKGNNEALFPEFLKILNNPFFPLYIYIFIMSTFFTSVIILATPVGILISRNMMKFCGSREVFYKLVKGGATGFNALTGEIRSYNNPKDEANFWSSDKDGDSRAWEFILFDNSFWVGAKLRSTTCDKLLNIRLIRD